MGLTSQQSTFYIVAIYIAPARIPDHAVSPTSHQKIELSEMNGSV